MLLGVVLRRRGFFGPKDYVIPMKLVLNITLPAAAITGFASYRPEPKLLLCAVVGFALNWAVLLIAALVSRSKPREIRAVWLNTVPGYNIGAFALPFVQSFLSLWNAYLWPLMVTASAPDMRTIMVGITKLNSWEDTNYELVLAGVTISLIPSFVLFALMRRNLNKDNTEGSLNG